MLHLKPFSRICFLASCLVFLAMTVTSAQTTKKIKVKPTDENSSSSARKQAYYYENFQDGKVVFLSGVVNPGNLNYNMLSGEIEFINSKKDTLELANMHTVALVTISTDSFYYDRKGKVLLKLLADYNKTKLLVSEKFELSNIKSVGAYGLETNSQAPNSTRDLQFDKTQQKLKQNETMIFTSKPAYYFSNYNRFLPANKSNVLKLFPNHETAVRDYISKNDTNFKNEEDLKKLLQFAAQL
jgi:hypothetical protein